MTKENLKQPLTRQELAEYLHVTPQTISRYVKQGRIKYFTLGRRKLFAAEEVANLQNQ
ncbi:MAG: helix-turn-helix domain-containing protein [Prevotella sp.]|nr:helix-turn-helix domain-containing protein [Prevotella sp.]